jgi:hypothetical protein
MNAGTSAMPTYFHEGQRPAEGSAELDDENERQLYGHAAQLRRGSRSRSATVGQAEGQAITPRSMRSSTPLKERKRRNIDRLGRIPSST